MSEALEAVGDVYSINGFTSEGRRNVKFYVVKDFSEKYSDEIEKRIGGITFQNNTRLGAAIRHAAAKLLRQESRTKLLIILTDGRPYDHDYGDARYAREDVREALIEAKIQRHHAILHHRRPRIRKRTQRPLRRCRLHDHRRRDDAARTNAEYLPATDKLMSDTETVFLFDVDNTLLDNDRVTQDLRRFLEGEVGAERSDRYWEIFEELRTELGYADYLGALQRYRLEHPYDSHVLSMSTYLINYPFANRLYPNSLDVLDRCRQHGKVVILTDGDVVFQPRKIERSGLFEAVEGNILIYIHKEHELADVERRYPAERYVMVDDKLRILKAMKDVWGERVTTVFPRQGHYAHDASIIAEYPAADISIERIGEILDVDLLKQ